MRKLAIWVGLAAASAALAAGLGSVAVAGHRGAELSALGPYPSLGGCPVFPSPPSSLRPRAPSLPNQAAWNQDISRAPLARRSGAIIGFINSHGGDHLHPDFGSPRTYGFPYAVVGRRQPKLPIHYTSYGRESDRGPFPIPKRAPVEGGRRSDGDRHVLVVDRSRCRLYELYRAFFVRRGRDHWNAGSGVEWNLRSKGLRRNGDTSADAAGLPIFPGLVRYEEARRGHVDHAIRITFELTRNAWIHPASHCAGDSSSHNAPPMGLRLRLRSGYGLRRFSGPAKAIARALKRYGAIVADNGSNWFFGGTSDRRWNDENLDQLKRIPGRAFQVVRSGAAVHRC
jgi:hypothetical protein